MDRHRWEELQDLFLEARALTNKEREALLEARVQTDPALVAQVRSLLATDAQPGVMDALSPQLPSLSHVLKEPLPERIGAYRVVSEIGRGGMGVVYLGERADGQFQQRVAIKLVDTTDAGDPLHQRFLAERQILAGLVHPHIARLLDGGITEDGRPFLAMEYVDGLPITTYCDHHHLDVRARLRLFTDVCAAVQHAHQNLIVHRDLKPSNILVSNDGRVHLLDFGIAKLIDPAASAAHAPLTRMELRVMTPEYASPEQVRGEVLTTASDLYSLGVLLYELLTGRSPYRLTTRTPREVATAVCEQDVERPSTRAKRADRGDDPDRPDVVARFRSTSVDRLARQLRGDLDGMVLMAMRKEPGRRYASADMLRQDIERHLTGVPVLAHWGSRRYRIEKFVRRHRVEVAAAVIVFASLVSGLAIAIRESRRANLERDRAQQALAESEGVTNFLLELYRTGDPGDPPPTQLSALDLLQRGALRATELSGQPIVHARLLDVMGQMSLYLGQLDEAQRQLEQAVAIRRVTLGDRCPALAASLIHLSWVHRARSDYEPARALVAEALAIRQRALPAGDQDIAEALYELGWLNFGPEQERLYREALAITDGTGAATERRVTYLQALSTNLRRQGRLDEAVDAGREALRVAEQAFGPDHHATGDAMIHLADHVTDIEQDHVAAEQLYRRGLELMQRHWGDNSTRLIHGLHSLGSLLAARDDGEAEQLFRRALAIRQSATGPEHAQVADELQLLAGELMRQRRLDEAEALARQALDLSARTLGPRSPVIPNARMPFLAEVLEKKGMHAEADRIYRSAIEQTPLEGVVPGQMHRGYGLMLLRRRDHATAEEQLLQSLAKLEQAYLGADHPNVQETMRALMELYRQWGKPDLVERYRVPPGRYVPY
jgi:serine/threonine-protein kinase